MRSLLLLLCWCAPAWAGLKEDVAKQAGDGVVYAVDAAGQVLLDLHGDRSFTPASTLKVVTTLLAAEHLGMDSRFETDFFLQGGMLVVRGSGDPFLVSEELDVIAGKLRGLLPDGVDGVAIDDHLFGPIQMPGVGDSDNPYDALNSATAVNFNTLNLTWKDGQVVSNESQTPLTPLAERLGRERGIRGPTRVNLGSEPALVRQYAAELIAAKLRAAGVRVGDRIGDGVAEGEPIYRHASSKTVRDACQALLYYSNNYIANQVFLAVGAKVLGAPATLDKGVEVARRFVEAHPALAGIKMFEGSGISYDNTATAPALAAALAMMDPYSDLLRRKHDVASKTGTLKVTKSVVGYLDTKAHGRVRFVISLDGGGDQRRWTIVDLLQAGL